MEARFKLKHRIKMTGHSTFHLATIIGALIVYALMVAFNALSSFKVKGLFAGEIGNISDKYYTNITPASFTFSIWGLIFPWQAVWLIYTTTMTCRKGFDGPLYRAPVLLPPSFFIVYILNNILTTSWLFVWDREMVLASFVILALDAVTLYICIAISMRFLSQNLGILQKAGLWSERWRIWLIVQNGLAVYGTWVSIATTLGLAMVMEYEGGVDHLISGTVALSVIAAGFLFWSIFELVALDKHARYLFMPYLVVCWALGGAIAEHWGKDWVSTDRNAIFTAVLLAVAVALSVMKLIVMLYRHFRKPLVVYDMKPTLS